MNVTQKNEEISLVIKRQGILEQLNNKFYSRPITRFAITNNLGDKVECEYAEVSDLNNFKCQSIFDFKPREYVNNTTFNAVMIVPTGVGADVGGDSGDANAAAKLIGHSVDTLITHPNVVNAADINEMTPNTLYIEGSVLNRFMLGTIGLAPTRGNKLLVIFDKPLTKYIGNYTVNTASAARVTLGCDIDTIELGNPPKYGFYYNEKGMAVGSVSNLERLLEIIFKYRYEYDAIALHTLLDGDSQDIFDDYFVHDKSTVNPWGGAEAILTHTISNLLDVTTAHAPMFTDELLKYEYPIVNPKKCAETLSKTELFCVLKGLYKSPKIVKPQIAPGVFTNSDIHVLITPDRCISLPILAALEQNITVIAVDDNHNIMKNDLDKLPWRDGQLIRAKNYLEVSGILTALKNGIRPNTVTRPVKSTKIL